MGTILDGEIESERPKQVTEEPLLRLDTNQECLTFRSQTIFANCT